MMYHVTTYLERRLKLTVNLKKSQVLRCTKLEYLGFMFWAGRIRVSQHREFRFRLKRLTGRNWFVSMDHEPSRFACYGFTQSTCQAATLRQGVDELLRPLRTA